jgi:hypothetical protein
VARCHGARVVAANCASGPGWTGATCPPMRTHQAAVDQLAEANPEVAARVAAALPSISRWLAPRWS